MFGWFRKKTEPTPQEREVARLQHHFHLAEGSESQRFAVAAAMSAIERDLVQRQRQKLPPEDEFVFMMAYECFVMWAIKRGMDTVLQREEIESAIVAIHRHFAKHAWYRADDFEKIWDRMQALMPMALKTDGSAMVYPITEIILAANQAGFPLDLMICADMELGIHVVVEIGRLANVANEMKGLR
jgi:hypothetical protein